MPDHTSSKSNKRKKFHDKDKYYKLAKEQGLRSRAAFKLSQINRQFPVLEKAKVVLDLCAAPGGWTQIAARTCPKTTQIIAVDILPIRAFAGHRNITTLIGDITTDKCKADLAREVKKNAPINNNNNHRGGDNSNKGFVDVVLHDGAPNIGASYDKDAYLQTEIALHALKCATHHLKRHGVFVTKLYRSRDYASYHWVMQQLFTNVHTIKPKASRSASAEIFLIGEDYLRPDTIDPKLLDPQHIFATVEGDTTVANATGAAGGLSGSFNIFHKSWDKTANRRQRDGYDLNAVDATLRRIRPISEFIQATSVPEAIQLLSTCSGFQFRCDVSPTMNEEEKKMATTSHTLCQWYLHHPFTSTEMKECATDLKVLNKADFRALLAWRDKMRQAEELLNADKKEKSKEKDDEADSDDSDDDDKDVEKNADDDDVEKEESEVQREIAEMRARKLKERKKQKKKERALASKKRKHAALGMNLNAIDIGDSGDPLAGGQVFSLATLTSKGDLDAVAEVNLDQMTDEQIFGANHDEDEELGMLLASKKEKDEETGYSFRLERELDAAYDKYLSTTKNAMAKVGTKNAKRSKKLMREKMAEESHEDHELILAGSEGVDADTQAYVKLLNKAGPDDDLDDDDSDREDRSVEDDDGFDAEPMTPQQHADSQKIKKQKASETATTSSKGSKKEKNPLIHEFPDQEPTSIKTARWFSNPLFAEIGKAAESATSQKKKNNAEADGFSEDDDESESEADEENSGDESDEGSKPKKKRLKKTGLDADDVLAMIPKTDKQVRHERRLKSIARDERRQVRKAKRLGDTEGEFDLAPQEEENEDDDSDLEEQMAGMSEERKQKLLEARKLIKDGMGQTEDAAGTSNTIEVVPQDRPLPVMDDRKYDSEHEDYDSDDYVRTLALGTMLLRRSKAKALVDASYNRYAWNDPQDLPEWFADDENRHYRPQLPIPAGLIAKMREKQLALSAKPIAKVAEARARKNKKAKLKLAAAKQKAQSVANSSEMSEAMKLKAISKALRSDVKKNAGKTYVVAKKGRGANGAKGVKVVDKRLKNDKRAMERSAKTKKSGKKGGLTGSKRRRHHS